MGGVLGDTECWCMCCLAHFTYCVMCQNYTAYNNQFFYYFYTILIQRTYQYDGKQTQLVYFNSDNTYVHIHHAASVSKSKCVATSSYM